MVSGRLAAGTSLGTSARAWTSWLEAGRELSREVPNTSGDACAINAPARSALECRRALPFTRPWVAAAHNTGCPWSLISQPSAAPQPSPPQQQYRSLHLPAAGRGDSSSSGTGRAGDDAPLAGRDAEDAHRSPSLTDLKALAQDWHQHALEASQRSNSSSINGNSACGSGLEALEPRAPAAAHGIPAALIERTCVLLDQRLGRGAFAAPAEPRRARLHSAPLPAGLGMHSGGQAGVDAAAAAAAAADTAQRRATTEALADILTAVASCVLGDSRSPPLPPDLARSLMSAATAAAHTATWPQAAAMLQGMVRMQILGRRFLDRILTRAQHIPLEPELTGAPYPAPHARDGPPVPARKRAQGMAATVASAGPTASTHILAEEAAPGAKDAVSLLRSLSALSALPPGTIATANLGGAMQRLMQHLQTQLHTLPGPAPLLGLLRDVTSCGWRHEREPEFLRRVADYLCTRAPPPPAPALAAQSTAAVVVPEHLVTSAAAAAGAAPAPVDYRHFGDCDDEGALARPPRLLALTPGQVVEVMDLYARIGVHHSGLMERGMDAMERCLPAIMPSQAARVAEACSRFYHHRPALMRRLALHVAAHLDLQPQLAQLPRAHLQAQVQAQAQLPHLGLLESQMPQPQVHLSLESQLQPPTGVGLPVAPVDVAAAVAALARCRVRDERFLDAVAGYAGAHAGVQLAEVEAQGRARAAVQSDAAQAQATGRVKEQEAVYEGAALGEPAALQGAAAAVQDAAAAHGLQCCAPGEAAVAARQQGAVAGQREAAHDSALVGAVLREVGFGLRPLAGCAAGSSCAVGDAGGVGSSARVLGGPGAGAESCSTTGGDGQNSCHDGHGGLAWQEPQQEVTSGGAEKERLVATPGAARVGSHDAAPALPVPGLVSGTEAGAGTGIGCPLPPPLLSAEGQVWGQGAAVEAAGHTQALPSGARGGWAADDDVDVSLLEALLSPPPAPDPTPAMFSVPVMSGQANGLQRPHAVLRQQQQPELREVVGPAASVSAGGGRAGSVRHMEPGGPAGAQVADGSTALGATVQQCSLGAEGVAARAAAHPSAAAAAGPMGAAAAAATAADASSSPVHRVSLERLAPDRTGLVVRRLSPALQPRALLDKLLAVPGAAIDLYYMPYDYAAVSKGRPGLGCAFLGVASVEGVAALARELAAGPVCGGAELASLEYLPPANSDALLRALLSSHSGYSPPRTPTTSRPLLLYVTGRLRGKVQPVEPRDVELYDLRGAGEHRLAPPQHGAFKLPRLQQQQQQLRYVQQQQPRHEQQQQMQHSASGPPQQAQTCTAHLDTAAAHAHAKPSMSQCGQPHVDGAEASPIFDRHPGGVDTGGETHGSVAHREHLRPPWPDPPPPLLPLPRPSCRQLLDVQQLALIAHSMAVLSYHPPGMLEALGQLMRRLLLPALPHLAADLRPLAADEAVTIRPATTRTMATSSAGSGDVSGSRSLPSQQPPLWPTKPPLVSVLHTLHALASQPRPDPAAVSELADECATALSAWGPNRCHDDQPLGGGRLQVADPPPPLPASTTGLQGPTRHPDMLPSGSDAGTGAVAAALALPPPEVLDVHVRLLAQALTAAADHGPALYHPRLCDAAAALLRRHLAHLRMRAACALLQPLVRLRHPPAVRLVAAVAPLMAQDCGRMSAASLVNLAWACARTGLRDDVDDSAGGGSAGSASHVVRALAGRTRQLLQQLPTAGVVQMFWALAALGYDGRGAAAPDGGGVGGPDLYWQLLQVLLQRYDLGARDLLLLQEGLELRRRWWRRRQQRRLDGPTRGLGLVDPAAADPGDVMESFLQELLYRAGAAEGAAPPVAAAAAKPQGRARAAAGTAMLAAAVLAIETRGLTDADGWRGPSSSAPDTAPLPGETSPALGPPVSVTEAADGPVASESTASPPSAGGCEGKSLVGEPEPLLRAGAARERGVSASPFSPPPLALPVGSEAGEREPPGADWAAGLGHPWTGATPEALASADAGAASHAGAAVKCSAEAAVAVSSCSSGLCSTPAAASLLSAPLMSCVEPGNVRRPACVSLTADSSDRDSDEDSSRGGDGDSSSGGEDGDRSRGRHGDCSSSSRGVYREVRGAAAAGERADALAVGGLLQQVLLARRGMALEEADGLLMRLQVPDALLVRAGAVSAAASS